jgi:hypothetical protein
MIKMMKFNNLSERFQINNKSKIIKILIKINCQMKMSLNRFLKNKKKIKNKKTHKIKRMIWLLMIKINLLN